MNNMLAALLFPIFPIAAGAMPVTTDNEPIKPDTLRVVDIEEVVVVASPKENVKLREQPVAVTLFSGESINSLGMTSAKDLTGFVPNLYIPDYGSRLTSSMYIRGVGSRINTPAVAMYVDNMPFTDKSAYDFTFLDIDRVDVLNGPQGTLYGRNSMGGLLRIFTTDPLRKQGTKVSIGVTSRMSGRRISATTNQKLSDNTAFSIGGYYTAENGFFRNDSTHRKADGSQDFGGRLRLVYRPYEHLKFDLQTNYSYSDEDAYPYFYTGKVPSSSVDEEYPDLIGKITANRAGKYRRSLLNSGLNVTYKQPAYILSSVTSFQSLHDRMFMDQDFLAADIYSLEQKQRGNTVSEELTLQTTGKGNWTSTTGLFALYQHLRTTSPVTFYTDGMTMLNSTIASYLPSPSYTHPITGQPVTMKMSLALTDASMRFDGTYSTPLTNMALFHQSVIKNLFVRNLSLTLGLRLDYEHHSLNYDMHANDIGYHFAMTMATPTDLTTNVITCGKRKDNYVQLLPKIALQYDLHNHTGNVYFTFGKGYRSGGYNIQMASELAQTQLQGNLMQGVKEYVDGILQQQIDNARNEAMQQMFTGIKQTVDNSMPKVSQPNAGALRYKPEYSFNYELGTHLNLAGRSLQVNAAIFFIDTRDQQIARYSETGLGRQMVNAGRSHSCGAELGIRSALFDNRLNISATYGFTHAEFKEYNDGKIDCTGNSVPMVPRHNASLAVDYTLPLNNLALKAITFGGDIKGLGRIYWTERNDTYQNFYATLGAHVTADLGLAQVSVWGKNLTCTDYDTFYFESMNRGFRQVGNPFHLGADVTFKF